MRRSKRTAAGKPALRVKVVQLPHGRGLPLPAYQSDGAAGMDLLAAVAKDAPLMLAPGARALVPTGLVLELPSGYEAQVRPRSGLALRYGVTVLNSPGTIDSDYRGEVGVLLVNLGDEPFTIRRGERVAQLVVQRVERAEMVEAATHRKDEARRRRLRLDRHASGREAEQAAWRTRQDRALTVEPCPLGGHPRRRESTTPGDGSAHRTSQQAEIAASPTLRMASASGRLRASPALRARGDVGGAGESPGTARVYRDGGYPRGLAGVYCRSLRPAKGSRS